MNYTDINRFNSISYSAKQNINATPNSSTAENKKKNNYGVAIAASTIGIGLTSLALGKGLSKSGRGKINKVYTYLTKKSQEFSKGKVFTKSEEFAKNAVNMGKSITESTRAVMNTISLKDILFKKITNPIPGVGKVCQGITDFFEAVAVKTTENSYKKTNKVFNKMFSAFEQANTKISKQNAQNATKKVNNLKGVFDKNFSVGECLNRIDRTKKCLSNLDEEFWERSFKQFKNTIKDKDTYSAFIAEQMVSGNKAKFLSEINANKAAINFSHSDDYRNIKNLADDIKGLIDPFNKEATAVIEKIKTNLDVFNKKQSPLAKETILNDMKTLTSFIEDKKIAEQFRKSVDKLPQSKKGGLQDLLEIYKKELSEKDYLKIEKQVNKAIKSLEKSTDLEADKLFDKMRDLIIGSAPTDMLTLIATFFTVGIGLASAENNDARESAALKFGIPAIGTVLTTMYGTLKMMSAGQSLIFGALSGLVINKIGEAADNIRLQLKGQKTNNNIVEIPTTKEVTSAFIDNTVLLSDIKRIYDGTSFIISTISDNVKFEGLKKKEA